MYLLHRSICPPVAVIHHIETGHQSPNPQEIHYFKWEFSVIIFIALNKPTCYLLDQEICLLAHFQLIAPMQHLSTTKE